MALVAMPTNSGIASTIATGTRGASAGVEDAPALSPVQEKLMVRPFRTAESGPISPERQIVTVKNLAAAQQRWQSRTELENTSENCKV